MLERNATAVGPADCTRLIAQMRDAFARGEAQARAFERRAA